MSSKSCRTCDVISENSCFCYSNGFYQFRNHCHLKILFAFIDFFFTCFVVCFCSASCLFVDLLPMCFSCIFLIIKILASFAIVIKFKIAYASYNSFSIVSQLFMTCFFPSQMVSLQNVNHSSNRINFKKYIYFH